MTSSNKKEKTKISIFKIAMILIIYIVLLAGIYYAGMCLSLPKSLVLAALIIIIFITALLIVIGLIINKKGKLKSYIKWMLSVFLILLICANIYMLNSTYFIPHITTTVHNRFYPDKLEQSNMLQIYLEDKVLWMDESNGYLAHDYDFYTPIDHSNLSSLYRSVREIKTLEESFGKVNSLQREYLLKSKKDYLMIKNKFERYENAYFYIGIDFEEYDDVVFLLDRHDKQYYMPYSLFLEIKEIR